MILHGHKEIGEIFLKKSEKTSQRYFKQGKYRGACFYAGKTLILDTDKLNWK